jgi:hypothetical protein
MKLSPPEYQSTPEAPDIITEHITTGKIETMRSEDTFGKIQPISQEASYLAEAKEVRSSNAKARMAWAQKVEKEIAPQILRGLGFTNLRPGNGRPVDLEASYHGMHYLIDVKYIAQMPSIIRKIASLVTNPTPSKGPVSRSRRRAKESGSWFQDEAEGGESTPVGHRGASSG